MRLTCPWCGPRVSGEFVYGGDASAQRPKQEEEDAAVWLAYLYQRENPRGPHREFWQHRFGCRRWLVVERDTRTHEILGTSFAEEEL